MADNILSIGTAGSTTPPSPAPGPLRLRGAWDSAAVYVPNDVVTYNNGLYGAKVTNSNVTPVDGGTWQVFVVNSPGPTGATGATGATGNSLLFGSGDPGGATGVDGNFYINTASHTLFGPKASGTWPSGTPLVGPTGATG